MFFKKKKKEGPTAIEITDGNFQAMVLESKKAVMLDFWAPWCGPCKVIGPIVNELSVEFEERALIGKVNVDENPKLSNYFKIKSIPTLVFIKEQQMLERISGMVSKPNLTEMLEDLIAFEVKK